MRTLSFFSIVFDLKWLFNMDVMVKICNTECKGVERMSGQVSRKYIFLVLGCCLLGLSPLIILFLPLIIPMTFYFEKYTWTYYTHMESYWVFGIGLAILVISFAILFFGDLKKWAVIVGGILIAVSCYLFYGSALGYMAFADKGITYRGLFETEKKIIGWDEITEVTIEEVIPGTSGNSTIIFNLKDGEVLSFVETNNISNIRGHMRAKFQQYNIPMEHIDAE